MAPRALLDSLRALEANVGTLRARLAGRRALAPIGVRVDTVRLPLPDTVGLGAMLDFRRSEAVTLWGVTDSVGTIRPGASVFAVPKNCDDGFAFTPEGVVCDADVLGSLSVYLGGGAAYGDRTVPVLLVGVEWRPYLRSPLAVALEAEANAVDGARARLALRWAFLGF
jgi:hypothetical protein